mgnify:CR=1 FL=1
MNKLSLEESLKILAPFHEEEKDIEPEENNRPVRKARRKIKTPSRSPVRIPKISPVRDYQEEKIETIESENSLYQEEKIEVKNKEKDVAPHTPTRFTIETPRTPTAKFDKLPIKDIDLEEKLKNYRYSIIKYLIDEDTNSIKYVICFDPNGQIIFINLDKKAKTDCHAHKSVKITSCQELPKLGSYQNALLEKLTMDIKGLVFYENGSYLFALREDNGDYYYDYYLLENQSNNDMLDMTQTYLVASLEELEKEPQYMINASKKNYQIIQQQQLLSNKYSFTHLVDSMEKLNKQMKNFDKSYKKYANNLVDDWSLLGSFAKDYYVKYGKKELNEIDKNKFDKVSLNMYARFQNFNEHIFMIQDILPLCGEINKITTSLAERQDIIDSKDKAFSGRIIETDEINNLI